MKYLETLTESDVSSYVTQQRMSAGGDVECIDLLMRIYGEIEMYETVWDVADAESYMARSSVTSLRGSTQHFRILDERNSSSIKSDGHIAFDNNSSNISGGGKSGVTAGLIPTKSQYERLVIATKEVLDQLPPELQKNFPDVGTR